MKYLALFALLEFFERHHVHRAHRFHARLHFVVIRLGCDQLFADQELALLRHQFFRLRVQFGHAGLAQIVAVGIIARFFDLALASLGAQLVERLPLAAQRFIELAGARARFVPFLFERRFQFLGAHFFLAQIFHLQRKLLARGLKVGLFLKQRAVLLVQRDRSLARQRHLLHEPLLGGLRAGKALGHRGKCFALRHHLLLQRLEIAAQLGEPLGRACGVGFRAWRANEAPPRVRCALAPRDCAPLPLPACSHAISCCSAASCCSTRRCSARA